jgi:hypothetical protein
MAVLSPYAEVRSKKASHAQGLGVSVQEDISTAESIESSTGAVSGVVPKDKKHLKAAEKPSKRKRIAI